MAVYLENTRLDASGDRAVMGEASEESLSWLNQVKVFATARKLFDTISPHSDDPRDATTFYVGSWFLVTYLMNGESEAFGRFQKRLHQLVPWRHAWDEAFDGMTTEVLDTKPRAQRLPERLWDDSGGDEGAAARLPLSTAKASSIVSSTTLSSWRQI
jgi:hypothetical protein